jgi:hypothetical protein
MADHPMMKRAYHVDGGVKEMYAVDAAMAVANHPDEWSWEPFSDSARDNYRAKVKADYKKAVDDAMAAGLPPPPPPPEPVVPTSAERRELDEDAKARAAAAEIVRAAEEKERKQREEDDKVAAAKALLSSPPQEIDPNSRRPNPVGRPTNEALAARAVAEKAAAEKAEAAKKLADKEANVAPAKK